MSDPGGRPEVAVAAPLLGVEERLREHFSVRVHEGRQLTEDDDLQAFLGNARGAVTLLENPVTDAVLAACPRLRVVANCAVGYDNIDVGAAHRRGVVVTNTPDVLTEATADLAWALILAVTRRVVEADRLLRDGRWEGWTLDFMLGAGLQGRTLGIVGYGRIGRAVARRAAASGMEVLYTDRTRLPDADPPARFVGLEELLSCSRVVSLHAPATPETRHLLDESRLRMIPRGGFVVNTARGSLVDEAALVRVLADGHLGGAGLDVYEREPEVHQGLVGRPDVVLLPHLGSATVETRRAMASLAVANVEAVLLGGRPLTPVP